MCRSIRHYLLLYAFLLVIIVTGSYVIIFINVMRNFYTNNLTSHKHCLSELDSLKYQLGVVTEYKNRLDKLLTETQRKINLDNKNIKEIMDNCLAMKQQSAICQSQFEDLQFECKKVKIELDSLKKESVD